MWQAIEELKKEILQIQKRECRNIENNGRMVFEILLFIVLEIKTGFCYTPIYSSGKEGE